MKIKSQTKKINNDVICGICLLVLPIVIITGIIYGVNRKPIQVEIVNNECIGVLSEIVKDKYDKGLYLEPIEKSIKEEGTAQASWYDQTPLSFSRKLIASGGYGVASAYVELGTRYLVRLIGHADLIVVTVNDYCAGCESGFDEFRRFDLSKEAFEALDTLSTGVIEIEYMELKGEGLSYE